jgi:hypothetical protein
MAGVKHLRRIQYGQESTGTAGTAVASTGVLRMNGTIEDARKVVFAEENIGILGGVDRAYIPQLEAKLEVEGEATFEQFPIILSASVQDSTGVADGAGSGFIYTFTFPSAAKNTIHTYTLEGGDDNEAEEMEYSHVTEWALSGKYNEAWMLSATWTGRQVSTSTFTASTDAILYAVDEMLFGKTVLKIDDDTGTIGTTTKSNTLMAAELKYVSGWIPKYTSEGQLYFARIENVGDEMTLDITFEHDGVATAEKAAWKSKTGRAVQLLITGGAVTSAGTTYSVRTCIINLYGKWEKFEKIDEIDGNDVIKGTLRCRYSINAAAKGSIIVVNERVAL